MWGKKLRRLSGVFAMAAALGGGLPFVLAPEPDTTGPAPAGKQLTSGELAEVKSVFGNAVDAAIVRKYDGGCVSAANAMETSDQASIHFCSPPYQNDDYSLTDSLENYGDFMHEMTHIWQFQAGWKKTGNGWNDCGKNYPYALDPKLSFTDYSCEQQADIVLDYALRFLHEPPAPSWYNSPDAPANDALLARTVEDQFPQAKITRLAIEAKRNTKTAPAPSAAPGIS